MKGQSAMTVFVIFAIIATVVFGLYVGFFGGSKIFFQNNVTNNITNNIFNNTVNNITQNITVTNNITITNNVTVTNNLTNNITVVNNITVTNNLTNNVTNNFTVTNNITNNVTQNFTFSGFIPASNVTNGTFGSADQLTSDYLFPRDLNVTRNFTAANVTALNTLTIKSGISNTSASFFYAPSGLTLNQTSASGFLAFMNNAINPQILAGNLTGTGSFFIDIRGGRPILFNTLTGGGRVETGGELDVDTRLNVTTEARIGGISGDGNGAVVCIKANGDLGTCGGLVSLFGVCPCS